MPITNASTAKTFTSLGAYLTFYYYNHLFEAAMKMKARNEARTVNEGYIVAVRVFTEKMTASMKQEGERNFYRDMLSSMCRYFIEKQVYSTITIKDLVRNISIEFVPPDYAASMSLEQQFKVTKAVLCDVISEFSRAIATDHVDRIVDDHANTKNIVLLRTVAFDLLQTKKSVTMRNIITGGDDQVDTLRMIVKRAETELQRFKGMCQKLTEEKATLEKLVRKQYAEKQAMMREIAEYKEKLSRQHTFDIDDIDDMGISGDVGDMLVPSGELRRVSNHADVEDIFGSDVAETQSSSSTRFTERPLERPPPERPLERPPPERPLERPPPERQPSSSTAKMASREEPRDIREPTPKASAPPKTVAESRSIDPKKRRSTRVETAIESPVPQPTVDPSGLEEAEPADVSLIDL